MPTYEYLCNECGHKFEEFQSITDEPLEDCIQCNGKVRKIISQGGGLIFRGSGFYVTDYKRSGKDKENKGERGKNPAPSKT